MEHFIETVHKYPCLWNTTAIEYRDQELKDAAWTEVMKETDLSSVKEVKLKWKKLRDSYRDALKRQSEMLSKEPGNAARRACPWKYMGLMQFLQPYMSNRKKAGESPPRYPAVPPPTPPGNGHTVSSSESESEAESEPPRRKGSDRLSLHDTKPQYPRRGRASKRAAERTPPPPVPAPPDPMDMFFEGMCQSTKRFPFHTQIKIKKSLFAAVIEAEESLLAEQQSFANLWARARPPSSSSSDSPTDRAC